MIRRTDCRAAAVLALCMAASSATATVLTGEVQAINAQDLFVPQANMSPIVLPFFVPEGERVNAGDVVLRIDPGGDSAGQLQTLEAQIDQTRARTAREVAELRVKALDAQIALVAADAAWQTAQVDAGVPKNLIPELDYDRYQGELERTARELDLKRNELVTARDALENKQRDGDLEVRKLIAQRDYHAMRLEAAEVRADRDGVVLHGFNNNWIGGRIDEGSQTMPGAKAGQVVGGGAMRVQAWALEPDRQGLEPGQTVGLAFDALPGQSAAGRIVAIAGVPIERPEWGSGRYFTVDIELLDQSGLNLLPGMSVRVDTQSDGSGPASVQPALDSAPAGGLLTIDGQIYARQSAILIPPRAEGVWNFNITRIAPDGAPVQQGDVVVVFDANNLNQRLTAQSSKLAEKQRELENLELDLAERERNEQLTTAEARANLEKAQRKTEQPEELIAGIEYRKLVIDRGQNEEHLALVEQREQLAAEQRWAERHLLELEIAQLQSEVERLQTEIASLTLTAPRGGLLMHRSSWRGEKFDVGSQVWIGQTIAEIPNPDTLAVRAELPERDYSRVREGARARIVVEGSAGTAVRGTVTSIGRTVRSKSRVQPVPVLDMEIALDAPAGDLRPGQAVRVQLMPAREEG